MQSDFYARFLENNVQQWKKKNLLKIITSITKAYSEKLKEHKK